MDMTFKEIHNLRKNLSNTLAEETAMKISLSGGDGQSWLSKSETADDRDAKSDSAIDMAKRVHKEKFGTGG